jgi:hypothetical protein
MKVENSGDLIQFMDALKEWAQAHGDKNIYNEVKAAEDRGETASALIIEYGEVLQKLKPRVSGLPAQYQENWDQALQVTKETISPERY